MTVLLAWRDRVPVNERAEARRKARAVAAVGAVMTAAELALLVALAAF